MRVAIYDPIDPQVTAELTNRVTQTYLDVARPVRASQSCTQHQPRLLHPQRAKSSLLSVAVKTSHHAIDRAAPELGRTEIAASDLYRFKALSPRMSIAPVECAAHA
jgi:hypothetical protein